MTNTFIEQLTDKYNLTQNQIDSLKEIFDFNRINSLSLFTDIFNKISGEILIDKDVKDILTVEITEEINKFVSTVLELIQGAIKQ